MRLVFSTACTVENAQAIHKSLLEALAQPEPVELDFSGVSQVDMSFFQLLVAAQRSFDKAGKSLTFSATLNPELFEKARFAGFDALSAASAALVGEDTP